MKTFSRPRAALRTAAAVLAAAFAVACSPAAEETGPTIGGAFELTAHTGERVTDADFRGRPMLVFFGFTYCPDVCPLSLQKMKIALDMLGEDAGAFQSILISVDPERDTPEALATYVASNGFPEDLVGLTGTTDEIAAVAEQYLVHYEKIEDPESAAEYVMEHTSIIYLMDSQGRFVKPFTHAQTPAEIADGLRSFLDERR